MTIQVLTVGEVSPPHEDSQYWTKCKMVVFNSQVEWEAFKVFVQDNVDENHSPALISLKKLMQERPTL